MYENFEKIPPEEQQQILTVCLDEFAVKGYDRASTNMIVKRAGIPKGTLFYYFSSKKKLFLYLIDHAVDTYIAEVDSQLKNLPSELFERLLFMHEVRFNFVVREPLIYQLLFNAFLNTPEAIMPELQERIQRYTSQAGRRRYEGLDRSKFKDDVDVEKAVELVSLISEGIYNRYLGALKLSTPKESLKLVDKLSEDVRQYFELIKQGIYR